MKAAEAIVKINKQIADLEQQVKAVDKNPANREKRATAWKYTPKTRRQLDVLMIKEMHLDATKRSLQGTLRERGAENDTKTAKALVRINKQIAALERQVEALKQDPANRGKRVTVWQYTPQARRKRAALVCKLTQLNATKRELQTTLRTRGGRSESQ